MDNIFNNESWWGESLEQEAPNTGNIFADDSWQEGPGVVGTTVPTGVPTGGSSTEDSFLEESRISSMTDQEFDQHMIDTDPRYSGDITIGKTGLDPNTLYKGMSSQEAMELYARLTNQHGKFYTNPVTGARTVIPEPMPNIFKAPGALMEQTGNFLRGDDVDFSPEVGAIPNPIERVGGYLTNIGRNTLKGPVAVRDYLTGRTDTEKLDVIPDYPTVGMIDSAIEELGTMAGGWNAGTRIASRVLPSVDKIAGDLMVTLSRRRPPAAEGLPSPPGDVAVIPEGWISLGRKAAVTGAGAAGSVVAVPSDLEPLFSGIDLDGDTEAAQLLQTRMNLMLEGIALSGVFKVGGDLATGTASLFNEIVIKRFRGGVSESAREEEYVGQIVRAVAEAGDATTPQEYDAIVQTIARTVSAERELTIEMAQRGRSDLKLARDTMSALEEGLKAGRDPRELSPEITNMIGVARELRRQGGGIKTEGVIGSPLRALDDVYGQSLHDLNAEWVGPAGRRLQEEADARFASVAAVTQDYKEMLQQESDWLFEELKVNPEMGERLRAISQDFGFDFGKFEAMTQDQINESLQTLRAGMKAQKDELYQAIPNDVFIDNDVWEQIVEDAEIPDVIKDRLNESNGNLVEIYNRVVPQISREISGLRQRLVNSKTGTKVPDPRVEAQIEQLEGMYNLFHGVDEEGLGRIIVDANQEYDPELVERSLGAISEAQEYFRDTYAPVWRTGNLQNFDRALDMRDVVEGPRQVRLSVEQGLQGDSEREYFKQIVDALSQSGDEQMALDLIKARAARAVQQQIGRGKNLGDLDWEAITGTFDEHARVLEENFPGSYDELNNFVSSLQAARGRREELQTLVDEALENEKLAQDSVYGEQFAEFFSRTKTGGFTPRENSYQGFVDLFDGEGNVDRIQQIVDTARQSGDEEMLGAMQRVYLQNLQDKAFRSQEALTMEPELDVGNFRKLFSEGSQFGDYGDIIFQDNPEMMYLTRRLLGASHDEAMTTRAKANAGKLNLDPGMFAKDARGLSDMVITLIWGPLSRPGARIRSGVSNIIAAQTDLERNRAILDQIYADPDYFLGILNRMKDTPGRPKVDSQEKARLMSGFLIRAGIYQPEDEPVYIEELTRDIEEYEGLTTPEPEDETLDEETERALEEEGPISP